MSLISQARPSLAGAISEILSVPLWFVPANPAPNLLGSAGKRPDTNPYLARIAQFVWLTDTLEVVLKPTDTQRFPYSYEEFADHIRAMRMVRDWEYTLRFGHLGQDQTSRANSARAVEYFSDSYENPKEAIYKADLFLSIYDYIARHEQAFARVGFIEKTPDGLVLVEPTLLRAVHLVFTASASADTVPAKRVTALAKLMQQIATP